MANVIIMDIATDMVMVMVNQDKAISASA